MHGIFRAILFTIFLFSNSVFALNTVSYVDPAQYVGTWYQIARNPHPFETGCVCSRQVLTPNASNEIEVYNTCNNQTPDGALREIRGKATVDDPVSNAKLTVDFGLPNKGKYWIIGLDPQYRYAVVSEPSMQSLYILSRTPQLAQNLYDEAVQNAAAQIDVSRLSLTKQENCSYPKSSQTVAISPMTNAPPAPSDASHPGAKNYAYGIEKRSLTCSGRNVTVFLPAANDPNSKFPAVVYGHGQALDLSNYLATMEHLAKKGVAAIFPTYDNGFFDQDWPRMARDYSTLTDCAITQTGERINRDQLIFSGHSKGAYVASLAAGVAAREGLPAQARGIILFQTAGFDGGIISNVKPETFTIVVFSDRDTIVERGFSDSVYGQVKSTRKQFILVKSYSNVTADHYWPQTKGSFFGGGPETALHYYGAWKWLVAAATDVRDGGNFTNPYVFGADAGNKGVAGFTDDVVRNW